MPLDNDLTCREAARLFDGLGVPTPIAGAYKERVAGLSPSERWRTERMHMADWFEANATTGFGQYTRKRPNDSARRCRSKCGAVGQAMPWEAVYVRMRALANGQEIG